MVWALILLTTRRAMLLLDWSDSHFSFLIFSCSFRLLLLLHRQLPSFAVCHHSLLLAVRQSNPILPALQSLSPQRLLTACIVSCSEILTVSYSNKNQNFLASKKSSEISKRAHYFQWAPSEWIGGWSPNGLQTIHELVSKQFYNEFTK